MENNDIQREGMLKVGTTLDNGKYRIDQYLASGGFGNTYMATNMAFDEKVAIKELFIKGVCGRSNDSQDISVSLTENKQTFAAQQEKFRKEARRLRKLTNAHIVKVQDLFDENGTSYYVMDFVEGESLATRLKRTKTPMSETELMLILPQVLDALECVHNQGIWHLDLKPANIMIDATGNVQLIDFGASKQLRNADGNSMSTSSAMAYTPGYASSEQMEQNMEKFGAWTDLYSLGATMYNLLTLQQPPSPSDIDEDAKAALKLPNGLSKKTAELIFWLMKPNRKMRPQSVADVKQFLLEVHDEKKPATTPAKPKTDDDTVLKRKPKPVTEDTKPKPTSDNGKGMIKNVIIGVVALACVGGGIVAFRSCKSQAGANGTDSLTLGIDSVSALPVEMRAENLEVKVNKGPENMRRYTYTGVIALPDSLPMGKGTASFDAYNGIPAATYEGEFVHGICEDNTGTATMTYDSGDKFVGTFKGGYRTEGRYTLSDGSYFEGTFKNGDVFNGKWYTADGQVDGTVVNGKES
ncbi:MAG: protein kinase [Bacteroidales bacterium]|nr:protein kinase [Bacteroidales bacterium]